MDLDQVVAQGLGALHIDRSQHFSSPQAKQVVRVLPAIGKFGDHEKLLRVAKRHEFPTCAHGAHIERSHVARQLAEGVMRPQHGLRPVRHVLVAEGARPHAVQNYATRLATQRVVHAQWSAVAITLIVLPASTKRFDAHFANTAAVQ